MTAYFLDSSALAKRYALEPGTTWLQTLTDPAAANALIIARITLVEVSSALARRHREQTLPMADYGDALRALRLDADMQYHLVELDKAVCDEASRLVGQYPLRAYDAVQLASVLLVHRAFVDAGADAIVFLTADDRLLTVAQAEGLRADNPQAHP